MTTASPPKQVVVAGAFDDLRVKQIRFLEEASRLGEVTALLWSDELIRRLEGRGPGFPQAERAYFLRAIRFVRRVVLVEKEEGGMKNAECPASLLQDQRRAAILHSTFFILHSFCGVQPDLLAVTEAQDSAACRAECEAQGIGYRVVREADLHGFPDCPPQPLPAGGFGRKKVLVTGCYDWVHSGHVRFFEEVSAYGDLYVTVGRDANIRLLKGPGHPLFPQAERRYIVGAIRYVTQALIATGDGWMDADPEIRRLKPDIYAVNEDGDKGGKREYCAKMGIEYLVLKRIPAPGLPPRTSTDLRGV